MKDKELDSLIDKYFEGETSLQEEKDILKELMIHPREGTKYEETLAVLSFASLGHHEVEVKQKDTFKLSIRKYYKVAAAACISVAILAGSVFVSTDSYNDSDFIAYVDGNRIENKTEVYQLAMADLEEFGQEDIYQVVSDQLEEFGQVQSEVNEAIDSEWAELSEFLN